MPRRSMPAGEVTGMTELEAIQAHVRQVLAGRAAVVRGPRMDELTALVIRHWPHKHLEAVLRAGGENHKGALFAMTLVRAQVRERWEARYGIGPLWQLLLGGTVTAISHVLLERWFREPRTRVVLRALSVRIARGSSQQG